MDACSQSPKASWIDVDPLDTDDTDKALRAYQFKEDAMQTTRLPKIALLVAAGLILSACSSMPYKVVKNEPPKPALTPAEQYPALVGDLTKTNAPNMVTPMSERAQNFTATGYAVISVQPHKLPAQQRLMAIRASKLDAYRSLTEQVYGQQLDASTTVADMVIQSDTFRTRVEGIIYGARLESINPVGDDTYETTLILDAKVVADIRSLYLQQLASVRR